MHGGKQLQFERMLFFSDAVFAIAITLLVIEIRLPERDYLTDRDVLDALLSLIPNYVGFLISFFVIGRFWIGHHMLFGTIAEFDQGLLWRNLLFLGSIAFMPFPTAVLSHFGASRTAVIFYALWLMLAGGLNWLLYRKVASMPGHQKRMFKSLIALFIGGAAALAALIHPLAGLGVLTLSPAVMRVYDRIAAKRFPDQTSASG